ncbi:hypothetical protein RB595_007159 [Gaeumannomyces hyphopodioides]
MEPEGPRDDPENLHSQVLRTTLAEIVSRPAATGTSGRPESDAVDCCVICLDVVSDPCEARPCGHRNFDFLCLASWLNHRPSCPLCKADVAELRYQFRNASNDPSSPQYTTYTVPRASADATKPARQPARPYPLHGLRASGPRPRVSTRLRRAPPRTPATTARETEEDAALERRRRVYRLRLFSLHVGTNRITRYTDLTPRMFDSDPELVSRARMWIRRELRVFGFLCASSTERPSGSGGTRSARTLSNNAEFLLEYIVAILRTVDINGSRGQAEEMLQEFLGQEHTRLFLHELRSWLRSPYTTLENWDAHVQYDETKSTPAAAVQRSSGEDSRGREESEQERRPAAYPDHCSGRGAARLHGSRTSSRDRWSPYSSRTPSRADAAESSRRTR